jgi:hypothetical protein
MRTRPNKTDESPNSANAYVRSEQIVRLRSVFAGIATHRTNIVQSEREILKYLSFASVRTRSSRWIIAFHFLFSLTDVHFL